MKTKTHNNDSGGPTPLVGVKSKFYYLLLFLLFVLVEVGCKGPQEIQQDERESLYRSICGVQCFFNGLAIKMLPYEIETTNKNSRLIIPIRIINTTGHYVMIQANFFRSARFEILENKTNCIYSSVQVPDVGEENAFEELQSNVDDDIVKEGGRIGVSVDGWAIYPEKDKYDLSEIMHCIKEKNADLNNLEIRMSNIKIGMYSPYIGFVSTNFEFVIKFTLDKNEQKINKWKCKKGSVL